MHVHKKYTTRVGDRHCVNLDFVEYKLKLVSTIFFSARRNTAAIAQEQFDVHATFTLSHGGGFRVEVIGLVFYGYICVHDILIASGFSYQ